MKYAFEKLEVWQKSRVLVKEIYSVTKLYPKDEKFGLTSQLRRASVSISSNIAEGSTRLSIRDKSRFYEIAYGSLIEVLNQLIISVDLQFLKPDDLPGSGFKLMKFRECSCPCINQQTLKLLHFSTFKNI
jgi:four helix bundle protein